MKRYIHLIIISEDEICTVLNTLVIPALDNETANMCDGHITEQECFEAMYSLKCDKTPGSDGLPATFYPVFWEDIKCLLCKVFNGSFVQGGLCSSMKRGIITLFPKKNKDRSNLNNWRPTSLLNTDDKLLAKILANRLIKVTFNIIDGDQTGFLKKRYIGESSRLLIDSCRKYSLPGLALSIDFEKAFDCVEWNFLLICLAKVG